MDSLDKLFEMQSQFQSMLNLELDEGNTQEYINTMVLALQTELSEFLQETQWKNPDKVLFGWKKGQTFNIEKAKVELIDILHFWINLCLVLKLKPAEILKVYEEKMQINIRRHENGY